MATRLNYYTVTLEGDLLGTIDDEELTLEDSIVVENLTGVPLNDILTSPDTRDPKALRALVWFLKYKAGKTVDLVSINFKLKQLVVEPVEVPDVVPSGAGARTKKSATRTSPTSPTSAI